MQKTKNILLTPALLCLMLFSVLYSDSLKSSVGQGVEVCLETIVPSLYFFMVISSMLMDSAFAQIFSKIFDKPSKLIFGFDGDILAIFVLSQLGGYPIGIKLLSKLCDKGQITRAQAMRYACFCFSSGPAFILGVVSHKSQLGAILISCVLSNIIAAVFLCRFSKDRFTAESEHPQIGVSLVNSAKSAASSLLNICIMILFMRALLSIAKNLGAISLLSKVFSFSENICLAFFEVTYVLSVDSLPLCAALLSFGGICVMLQLRSIASFDFNMTQFLIIRLLCAILSAIICSEIYTPIPTGQYISAMATVKASPVHGSAAESILLIIMCCILLSKNSRQMKNNVL